MQSRITFCIAVIAVAAIIWSIAFVVYDIRSTADAWLAYRETGSIILVNAALTLAVTTACLSWRCFNPGRLISGIVIGIIAAALILPSTSMSRRHRRQMVAEDRFIGFKNASVQYIAFATPLIIGGSIATRRSDEMIE